MNTPKRFELARLRRAVEGYLDSFEEELLLGTHERHLRRLEMLCRVLLDQLVAEGGGTLETQAFSQRLTALRDRFARRPSLRLIRSPEAQ
ncbi:MAG TPA: hypothetical protein VIU86_20140 [Gaiellaceae bacterium]